MAYYLMVKGKGDRLLDVTGCASFNKMTNFKVPAYSLEEIDLFTANYDSELEFKKDLYSYGLISIDEITSDIVIGHKLNGKLEVIGKKLVYKDMAEYLNPTILRNKILDLRYDKDFLSKLVSHYKNSYFKEYIREIREIVNNPNNYELRSIDVLLSSFYYSEIYAYNAKTNKAKLKYKALHDLALFVYNYLYTLDRGRFEVVAEEYKQKCEIRKYKDSLLTENGTTKKRTKKIDTPLDGQISFFE